MSLLAARAGRQQENARLVLLVDAGQGWGAGVSYPTTLKARHGPRSPGVALSEPSSGVQTTAP